MSWRVGYIHRYLRTLLSYWKPKIQHRAKRGNDMRIEKTDLEFIEFDERDVIVTSASGGTVGVVNYYWISKNGVSLFNDNNQNYLLTQPTNPVLTSDTLNYTYARYTVGEPSQYSGYTFWSCSTFTTGALDSSETAYLISDSEIQTRFDEVVSWLKGTTTRS